MLALPAPWEHFDPCGEYGEYHTRVINGPLFHHPLAVRPGGRHVDGPFALLDVEADDGREPAATWPVTSDPA